MNSPQALPFWSVVGADLYRYGNGVSISSFVREYVLAPGFKYTFWMRLTNHLRQSGLIWRPCHYLCRAILHHFGVRYGISVPYNTPIDPGLYIGHHGGIVINDKVVIGYDCNINHEVTIGVKYGGRTPGVPVIGDRVFLGPGCKVIGGICLGNDVAVGANSVVVESVPDCGVAAGVPAKVISFNGSKEYVVNTQADRGAN
ncbi:MAG: serine acetyltransferase [Gammaproteobacteria bacterium]|nr:serine acetyltransferase [Gammaproteobacteria bacterium]